MLINTDKLFKAGIFIQYSFYYIMKAWILLLLRNAAGT